MLTNLVLKFIEPFECFSLPFPCQINTNKSAMYCEMVGNNRKEDLFSRAW